MKHCYKDEIASEKAFNKELLKIRVAPLALIGGGNIGESRMLLEYVEGSTTLNDNLTEKNYKQWGAVTKKIHSKKIP